MLTRFEDNTSPVIVGPLESGSVGVRFIPEDLRTQVEGQPDRQHLQVSTIDEGGDTLSAVIVGQRIDAGVAGDYGLYFIYPMHRERETISFIGQTFLLGGAALILLLGAIAFVVTRLVADPVRRAAIVAERFADGNLDERMQAKGEDDLARLGTSFNGMAASIQQQIAQLENLSRVQQRFVSDVSHELRTPLTTIRMAGDLIHDSRRGFEPTVARSAELLHHELDRFESLLTDLLEISRFDAGAAVLEVEASDLRASVDRAVDAHRTLAARKGTESRRPRARRAGHRRDRLAAHRARAAQPRLQRDRARRGTARRGDDRQQRLGRRGHRARPRGRAQARRGGARLHPVLAGRPCAGAHDGRHRPRPRDRPRGRPPACRSSRGLGGPRGGLLLPPHPAAQGRRHHHELAAAAQPAGRGGRGGCARRPRRHGPSRARATADRTPAESALARARAGGPAPGQHLGSGAGNGSGFADDDTLRLRRIVPERTP